MGIEDTHANENWIRIFPNPVLNELTIEANLSLYQIEIFDAVGRTYRKIYPIGLINTIDISSLPKGLYFIRVLSKTNNLVEIRKIVKQ